MAEFSVAGRRVVVVGAARSGVAAVDLLLARGARVTLTDTRPVVDAQRRLQAAGVALELGWHRPETLAGADLIVLSPGVPPQQPALDAARRAGVPIIGEIELAWRWLKGLVVAITGTKGKSTTAALAGRILEVAGCPVRVGGNIGAALSTQVEGSTPETIHVVEVSSFQLEGTRTFRPRIAVLLNVSPDHLDRHGSIEAYREAKARVFTNQLASDWAVVNADDALALELARRGCARHLPFALETPLADGIVVTGGAVVRRTAQGDTPLVPLSSVRLPGCHLLSDVLAATAVGILVGVSADAMARAVASFEGLEHTLEPVAEIDGVRFVNDSKATNVVAARRAIESFPGRLVVILGGRFKGGDLRDLREPVRAHARLVLAIGEAQPLVHDALDEVVPVRDVRGLAQAVRDAFAEAVSGDTVLLAPACASFDMFRDYAERGQVFKEEVRRLAADRLDRREP